MSREVEQRIGFGNAHPLGTRRNLDDLLARLDLTLFDHAEVETGPAVGNEQRSHPGLVHPDADAVARHTRLRYLEYCAPDPIAVPDAHLGIGQAVDGEVLAELAANEVIPPKLAFPVAITIDLVDKDRPLFAAMADQVALPVTLQIQPARHARARNGALPDRGMDRFPVPRDIVWKADVYRQQPPNGRFRHGGHAAAGTVIMSTEPNSRGQPASMRMATFAYVTSTWFSVRRGTDTAT